MKFEVRLSAEQRAAYEAEAKRSGLSLSEWLRRSADEAVALANALEVQVEDARQAQRRRQEQPVSASPASRPRPARPPRRPNHLRGYVGTIGDAPREADAKAR